MKEKGGDASGRSHPQFKTLQHPHQRTSWRKNRGGGGIVFLPLVKKWISFRNKNCSKAKILDIDECYYTHMYIECEGWRRHSSLIFLILLFTKPNIEVSGWLYQTKIHFTHIVYQPFSRVSPPSMGRPIECIGQGRHYSLQWSIRSSYT